MLKNDRQLPTDEVLFQGYFNIVKRESKPGVVRHIALTNDAAAVMYIDDTDTVWFNREYREATNSYSLQLPAGTHEKNKTEREMILDELVQEQGKKIKDSQLEFLGTYRSSIGIITEEVGLYIARGPYTPVPQALEHGEDIEPVGIKFDTSYQMFLDGKITDPRARMLLPLEKTRRQQEYITNLETQVKLYEENMLR